MSRVQIDLLTFVLARSNNARASSRQLDSVRERLPSDQFSDTIERAELWLFEVQDAGHWDGVWRKVAAQLPPDRSAPECQGFVEAIVQIRKERHAFRARGTIQHRAWESLGSTVSSKHSQDRVYACYEAVSRQVCRSQGLSDGMALTESGLQAIYDAAGLNSIAYDGARPFREIRREVDRSPIATAEDLHLALLSLDPATVERRNHIGNLREAIRRHSA